MTHEPDLRVKLLNSLLTTPHRNLEAIYPVHQEILAADPRFYVQLAAWYAVNGEVRDHKEMFALTLALSDFPGHRDVGLALLREMPPYQVGRVVDYVKGRTRRRKVRPAGQQDNGACRAPTLTERLVNLVRGQREARASEPVQVEATTEWVVEKWGLFLNVPRSMKTELTRYLREREADPIWFDGSVLQARHTLKRLYASLRIKPSPRAQAILFDETPPRDSRLYALKQIARAESPAEQARAIVEHRIPFRVAVSVIKQITPTVLVALIHNMSPQEVINSLGALRRYGAYENAEVKQLIEEKLAAARQDSRVSAYKAKEAIRATNAPTEIAAQLDAVTESQLRNKGTIRLDTALLIDKSGSMSQAIEIGKRLGSMIAGVTEGVLYTYAFDTLGYPVEAGGASLADWEEALEGIRAGGSTSCGVAVEMMRRAGQRVDQIVMVTDEGENHAPYFVEALGRYNEELGTAPHVVFVKTRGATDYLERACREARIPFDAYQFSGDYYSLPNLLPLLSRPSKLELLLEIMAFPLPQRKSA